MLIPVKAITKEQKDQHMWRICVSGPKGDPTINLISESSTRNCLERDMPEINDVYEKFAVDLIAVGFTDVELNPNWCLDSVYGLGDGIFTFDVYVKPRTSWEVGNLCTALPIWFDSLEEIEIDRSGMRTLDFNGWTIIDNTYEHTERDGIA